ncbi:MAG: hypothetical protein DMG03_29655, partial [Acidobacteria bacterium]
TNPFPMGAVCAWTGCGTNNGPPTLQIIIAIAVTIAERFADGDRRHVNNFDTLMVFLQPKIRIAAGKHPSLS